ncbi:MAG TPA: hypothetical protein PKJ63_01425 [Cyclobacteriaceae bacterium]|nr:hypothetical protein [Cyclobacteriaceae bacterium]
MGSLVDERVLLELSGYLVVQIVVPASGYRSYAIARGTKEKYYFVYRNGGQASFNDLVECEAYFSGLLTNQYIEREIQDKGALQVKDGVLPLMEVIRESFSKISSS